VVVKFKKKLLDLEILRALAIIMIVIFHANYYIKFGYNLYDIGQVGVSLFIFVSGFLLYYTYKNINFKNGLKNFYTKRFVRIYPLYWFAIIISFLWLILYYGFISFPYGQKAAVISSTSILFGFLGLQGFLSGNGGFNQSLFWFVGVIILYYLIYPFLTKPKKLINIFLVSTIIFIIFIIFYLLNLKLFIGFFIFYWIFFAGIATCWLKDYLKNNVINFKQVFLQSKFRLLGIILVLILIFLTFHNMILQHVASVYKLGILQLLLVTLLIYAGCRIFVNYNSTLHKEFFNSKLYDLVSKISKGSYATYLLHETILSIIAGILTMLHLTGIINIAIIFIGIPLVFIVGYYVQIGEYKVVNTISKKLR